MRSMRVQIFAFLGVLMAILLLLVNIYPIITARDTAFHEKENAMGGQATTLAAALAKLDRPDSESVAEVARNWICFPASCCCNRRCNRRISQAISVPTEPV